MITGWIGDSSQGKIPDMAAVFDLRRSDLQRSAGDFAVNPHINHRKNIGKP